MGHHIDKLTVRNILRRHHIDPAPQRRKAGMSWGQFVKLHWEVLAATDFFTVEVATWHGLVTYSMLVVMEVPPGACISRGSRHTLPMPACSFRPLLLGGHDERMRQAVEDEVARERSRPVTPRTSSWRCGTSPMPERAVTSLAA